QVQTACRRSRARRAGPEVLNSGKVLVIRPTGNYAALDASTPKATPDHHCVRGEKLFFSFAMTNAFGRRQLAAGAGPVDSRTTSSGAIVISGGNCFSRSAMRS